MKKPMKREDLQLIIDRCHNGNALLSRFFPEKEVKP